MLGASVNSSRVWYDPASSVKRRSRPAILTTNLVELGKDVREVLVFEASYVADEPAHVVREDF